MSELKLAVNRLYRNRLGNLVLTTELGNNDTVIGITKGGSSYHYYPNGRYLKTGEHDRDLIEEVYPDIIIKDFSSTYSLVGSYFTHVKEPDHLFKCIEVVLSVKENGLLVEKYIMHCINNGNIIITPSSLFHQYYTKVEQVFQFTEGVIFTFCFKKLVVIKEKLYQITTKTVEEIDLDTNGFKIIAQHIIFIGLK